MAAPPTAGGGRFGCYVGNIDASVPIETIRQVFSQCGQVLDASLNGRETDPYRFGFIDFSNEADRERALKFNGITLAGRQLKVGVSKGNVGRPGEGASNNRGGHGDAGISESTALLVQLVQSGAVNPANLTAEQQRLLSGALLGGMAPMGGGMAPPPMMPTPPMMGGMMPPHHGGGYGGGYAPQGAPSPYGGAPRGAPGGYRRGPPSANPPPSEELVMLRQAQRKTFFDKVTKEAERYQEKLQKRKNKRDGGSDGSDSDSSSSDDEEKRRRRSKEHRTERSGERRDDRRDDRRDERRDDRRDERQEHSTADRRDEQRQQPDDSRNAL